MSSTQKFDRKLYKTFDNENRKITYSKTTYDLGKSAKMILAYNDVNVPCMICGKSSINDYIFCFDNSRGCSEDVSVCVTCLNKTVERERTELINIRNLASEREQDDGA